MMSDQPGDDGYGGQNSGGGQPPNNQPQGGQPQGGQYPGGQQQQYRGGRGPPQQAGTGVGDIFNREDTKDQIKQGIVLFAAIGVGLGLIIILGDALADQRIAGWSSGPLLASLITVLVAQNHTDALAGVEDSLAYATPAVTAAAGTLVISVLTWLSAEIVSEDTTSTGFGEIEVSSPLAPPDIGDAFLAWVVAAIGVAVIAVIIVFADRNL